MKNAVEAQMVTEFNHQFGLQFATADACRNTAAPTERDLVEQASRH
jgi:hypothetical protein